MHGELHTVGTLRLYKAKRVDDGLYECVARNKANAAYKVGHIAVEYPPNFDHMKNIPPVYTWNQQVANLSCLAAGIMTFLYFIPYFSLYSMKHICQYGLLH